MTRDRQIHEAAKEYVRYTDNMLKQCCGESFNDGAKWADEHSYWNNLIKHPEILPEIPADDFEIIVDVLYKPMTDPFGNTIYNDEASWRGDHWEFGCGGLLYTDRIIAWRYKPSFDVEEFKEE